MCPSPPPPQVTLLYANRAEDDILLREELEALAAAHPHKLKVWYTLDCPPEVRRRSVFISCIATNIIA